MFEKLIVREGPYSWTAKAWASIIACSHCLSYTRFSVWTLIPKYALLAGLYRYMSYGPQLGVFSDIRQQNLAVMWWLT